MGILRILTESGQSALGVNYVGKEGWAKVKRKVMDLFGEGFFDKFH